MLSPDERKRLRQQWQEEAENPQTPAARLIDLFQEAVSRIKKAPHSVTQGAERREHPLFAAIGQNPNTPPNLLHQLERYVSIETIFQNPVAPFLLLESPGWVLELATYQQQSILRSPNAPLSFVMSLASGAADRGNAPFPVGASSYVVVDHLAKSQKDVADEARQHIVLTGELSADNWQEAVRAYFRGYCANPWSVRKKATLRKEDIERERQLLWDYVELGLLPTWAVTAFPHTEPVWQSQTAASDDAAIMASIPTGVSTKVLTEWLRKNSDSHAQLAQNPATTEPILRLLAQSNEPLVRRLVRRNSGAASFAFQETRYSAVNKTRWTENDFSLVRSPLESIVRAVNGTLPFARGFLDKEPPSWWLNRLAFALCPAPSEKAAQERCGASIDDGNRLVRAASRARIANPDFVFNWDEKP